jgi:tetratricopeptide (TPR) repeat protein
VDAEIAAAFSADGVIGVSNAPSAAPGSSPAYALGGTIQRDGDTLRVITRLTNERSGATLWSDTFDYAGNEAARIPRHIAVDAGNIVRCGLFGASTYPRALPDNVLRDYLQFCQGHWDPDMAEGGKALLPAQRVVAAVPDFSWGWAAVAGGFWKVAMRADSERAAAQARADGRAAADRAIAIDARNSEALYIKALLLDRHDWVGREALLQRALAARRLDCGCEHHQYGFMLANVGRISDAVEELRRANDMLALYVYTPITLADALVAAGKPAEAKRYYEAAASLAPDAGFAAYIAASAAGKMGDARQLSDPAVPMPDARRSALLAASRAMQSGDADARTSAAGQLAALPTEQQNDAVAIALARLGDPRAAFDITRRLASREYPGPSIFWYPSLRSVLDEPGFPAEAERLGLMHYWKTQGVRPDVCKEIAAPAFCTMP